MNVFEVYRSLTAEQKRTLRHKRLEMNRPAAELLAFLKPLAACDAMSDKARTKLGCTFGLLIVGTIAALVVGFHDGWSALPLLILIGVLALTFGFGYLWSWTRGIDVSNNFRQFAVPVLTVLRDDFDPAHPVHLQLDLTSPTTAAKKRGESAPYKKGAYYKVIDTTYVDEWMSLEGVLVDGTKLSWRVSDSIRERKKTKRNPRGKIKTKTRYKKKSEIEVSMGLKKKTYDLARSVREVSSDDKRHTVRMSRQVVTASLDPIDPRALLDLLASIFRNTRPAKESA